MALQNTAAAQRTMASGSFKYTKTSSFKEYGRLKNLQPPATSNVPLLRLKGLKVSMRWCLGVSQTVLEGVLAPGGWQVTR